MSFLEPGRNLLLHGRFIADGAPDLLRTPGYPLFLAVTSLAGLTAAALANVILSVISVILVWKLARSVFDDNRIALGAAWSFAFEPLSAVLSVALLSESLFLFLLLLCLERLAVFLRERQLRVLLAAGLWLAAATFVRPITYYLPVALALGLLFVLMRVPGLRWKAPAILLISVLPWLAAWQIRNCVETGYGGFSSIGELDLYFLVAPEVIASGEHRSFFEVRNELGYVEIANHSGQDYLLQPYLALHPEQQGWSQGQRLAFMHSQATRIVRAHFGPYLHLYVRSLFQTVFNPGAGFFDRLLAPTDPGFSPRLMDEGPVRLGMMLAREHPWVAAEKAAFVVVLLGMYLFALRGVLRGGVHRVFLWLLLGTSLYLVAISAVVGGVESRYRHPVMPVVCIFASAGFQRRKPVAG
jgi:4-amino-4-deoxy-L-arabinose transferase-like glycosyltransferase